MYVITRILQLMDERGINAARLTSDLGLASSSITEWKKGRNKPGLDAVIKIAKYFNVSADYLLTGKETINQSHLRPILNEKGSAYMSNEDKIINLLERALADLQEVKTTQKLHTHKLNAIEGAINLQIEQGINHSDRIRDLEREVMKI